MERVKTIVAWMIVIIGVSVFWALMDTWADNDLIKTKAKRIERGIIMYPSERDIKYTPSGIVYFVECIEGREFIILNPGNHGQAATGPINDKEC